MKKFLGIMAILFVLVLAGCGESTSTTTDTSSDTTTTTTTNTSSETYTVTFIVEDETYYTEEITAGDAATEPTEPTLDNYSFDYWCSDEDLTTEFDFSTSITSDITLYAKWTDITYTVTFIVDDETYDTETVISGDTVDEPETPSETGYTFDGWYENTTDDTAFDFTTEINSDLTLYAVFTLNSLETLEYDSYDEGIYVKWSDTDASDTTVEYKSDSDDSYTEVNSDLIRQVDSSTTRVDILGLSEGNYTVRVTKSDDTVLSTNEISVSSYDRSGYAHFDYDDDGTDVDVSDGIGSYTNNGTLKSNAVVVYVSEDTKNTVTATLGGHTATGIVQILQYQRYSSYPLDIRIEGTIGAATWNEITYASDPYAGKDITYDGTAVTKSSVSEASDGYLTQDEIISLGLNTMDTSTYDILDNLTNKMIVGSDSYDSYWNMCDVSYAENVTVEGVGDDAIIDSWGFTFKDCSSIEVRNLTFENYTEDACSAQGNDNSTTISGFTTGHIWIHNNTFDRGYNSWDVSDEQDKGDGDGSTDFKKLAFVTIDYNVYYNTHKTCLIGGSDSQYTSCITIHHNYFDNCQARLPFVRQANVHIYNNYYYSSTGTNMQVYAGAYAFIEGCYFEGVSTTYKITSDGTSETAAVKSYNNTYDDCSKYSGATIVSSRTESVDNDNVYDSSFDTSTTDFYYDAENECSDVTYLTSASVAKEDCLEYAGVHTDSTTASTTTTEEDTYTVTFIVDGDTYDTESVVDGSTVTLPDNPTKSGYTFENWYTDDTYTTVFDSTTEITSDITVYAYFEEGSETETYTLNATDLYTELGLSSTKKTSTDTTYETAFTLTSGVRIKSSCFSNNKDASYYNSSSDYSCVILVDVTDGYTGDLTISMSSSSSDRIIYLYKIEDGSLSDTLYASGYEGDISASDLTSGTYVIVFTEGVEPKISQLNLVLTAE